MPLIQYILQNLGATCIPVKCFKFSLGERVFDRKGKSCIIIGIIDTGNTTFYRVQFANLITEVPESELLTQSEMVCQLPIFAKLDNKIKILSGIVPQPDTPSGTTKINIVADDRVKRIEEILKKVETKINKLKQLLNKECPTGCVTECPEEPCGSN